MGGGNGEAAHTGSLSGGNTGDSIFNNDTVLRLNAQTPGGEQEDLRVGFTFGYIPGTDYTLEVALYAQSFCYQFNILNRSG